MRKIFVLVLLMVIVAMPVFAENWVQFKSNSYVDADSVEEYVGDDGQKQPDQYSIWVKSLNNNTQNFTHKENIYKTKISYIKSKAIVDLKRKTIAKKCVVIYDMDEKVIKTIDRPDSTFRWFDIKPRSNSQKIMNVVKRELFIRRFNFGQNKSNTEEENKGNKK